MKNISDEELLDFIDKALPLSERKTIELRIEKDEAIKKRYHELLEVHMMLSNKPLHHPSEAFVDRIVHSLDHHKSRFRKSGFVLFLAALSIVLIGAVYLPDLVLNLNIKPIKLHDFQVKMPQGVDLKQLNIILLSALSFISLLLFEKTVLKPFFKR